MSPKHFLYSSFLFASVVALTNACGAEGEPGNPEGGNGGTLETSAGAGGGNGEGTGGKHGPNHDGDDAGSGGNGGSTFTTTTSTEPAGGAGGGGGSSDAGAGGMTIQCMDSGIPQVLYMSSDDSSSMGSPAIARDYLEAGLAPPMDLIRPWEFLNYYRVRFPAPEKPTLGIHANFAPTEGGDYRLQIGVQAFQPARPKMALTFVVDTSGSLVGEGIAREQEAIVAIAGQLAKGDRVSFVTWANDGEILLQDHEIEGPNDPALLATTEALLPGGGSDLHAGLMRGYALAAAMADEETRLSRVVLMSDGGANVGVVDKDAIALAAKNGDDKGIYLIGIGIGPATGYSDALMNTVTDAGRGAYVFLDSEGEAQEILGDRFDEVMDIAARSVRVKVTLPSYFEFKEFNGELVSSDPSKVPPQHLAPGDSMIFDQILKLSPGGALCANDAITVETLWENPFLHKSEAPTHATWSSAIKDIEGETWQLLKSEAVVRYARMLATRDHLEYEAAQAAVSKALASPDVTQDPFWTELEDIEALIQKFPAAELK